MISSRSGKEVDTQMVVWCSCKTRSSIL